MAKDLMLCREGKDPNFKREKCQTFQSPRRAIQMGGKHIY